MTKLSVNVNKVATLRNTRALAIPGVTHLAKVALDAAGQREIIWPSVEVFATFAPTT